MSVEGPGLSEPFLTGCWCLSRECQPQLGCNSPRKSVCAELRAFQEDAEKGKKRLIRPQTNSADLLARRLCSSHDDELVLPLEAGEWICSLRIRVQYTKRHAPPTPGPLLLLYLERPHGSLLYFIQVTTQMSPPWKSLYHPVQNNTLFHYPLPLTRSIFLSKASPLNTVCICLVFLPPLEGTAP